MRKATSHTRASAFRTSAELGQGLASSELKRSDLRSGEMKLEDGSPEGSLSEEAKPRKATCHKPVSALRTSAQCGKNHVSSEFKKDLANDLQSGEMRIRDDADAMDRDKGAFSILAQSFRSLWAKGKGTVS